MTDVPSDLKFTATHEWVREEDDGKFTVGITDHAQQLLGDLVFVELPHVDSDVRAGDECAVIESVKAASDVYTPLSGTIIEVNAALSDAPELINQSAYDDGWLFRIEGFERQELDNLLDASDYLVEIDEE